MIRIRSSSIAGKLNKLILLTALAAMVVVSFPIIIVFSAIIRESALNDKINLMHEIMNQVDFNISSVIAESRRIQMDSELGDLLVRQENGEELGDAINIRLNALIAPLGTSYRNVFVITGSGKEFNSITRISEIDRQSLVIEPPAQAGYFYLSAPMSYMDGLNNRQSVVSFISSYRSINGVRCRLVINLDFSMFETIFRSVDDEVDEYLWIGYGYTPIYPAGNAAGSFDLAQVRQVAQSSDAYFNDVYSERGVNTILIYSKSSAWVLAAQVSVRKLLEQYNWFIFYYLISIVVIVMIILATVLPMMKRQLRPLRTLAAMMKELSTGNLDQVSDIRTNDEVESLSKAFNTMTSQLKFYIAQTVADQKDKERLRYSLLISQINPHFIYNTLNTITYLVRQKQYSDIIVVNAALIKILRDSLRIDAVQIFDTVDREIDVVNQYITIQHYRYGNTFTVSWHVDDEARRLSIPKNLIQPLVENALFHGLLPAENPDFHGLIDISIRLAGQEIIITVADNGVGMDDESLARTRRWIEEGAEFRGKHVGLRNIIGRVSHLYGSLDSGSRLRIESRPQQGTAFTIILDRTIALDHENSHVQLIDDA